MALLHLQGFDDSAANGYPGWSGLNSWSGAYARTGTKGVYTGDAVNRTMTFTYSDAPATTIMGVAWRPVDIGTNPSNVLSIRNGSGTTDITLYLYSDGSLALNGPFGTSTATAASLITLNQWYYLEIKYVPHDTTGSYDVRINETSVLSDSGIDTKAGTEAYSGNIYFYGSGSSDMDQSNWDDFYLCDATTSHANDFLGDTAVHSLYPIGDGNASNMLGSDGDQFDNWALVDEATPSSTDYVGAQIEGTLDTYQMGNLGSTAYVIHGVQTSVYGVKSDVGNKYMRHVLRTGSTGGAQSDNVSDAYILTTSNVMNAQIWNLNPATASTWTEGEITAMEVGQEVRNTT